MATIEGDDSELRGVLPQLLAEMVEIIPLEAVFQVALHYGGRQLYIPSRGEGADHLRAIVGEDATAALTDRFRGELLNVPKAVIARTILRNRALRNLRRDGHSISNLAARFGLTMRQVTRILSSQREQSG